MKPVQKFTRRLAFTTAFDVGNPLLDGLMYDDVFTPGYDGTLTGFSWELKAYNNGTNQFVDPVTHVASPYPYGNTLLWMFYRERDPARPYIFANSNNGFDLYNPADDMISTGILSISRGPLPYYQPLQQLIAAGSVPWLWDTTGTGTIAGPIAAPAGTGAVGPLATSEISQSGINIGSWPLTFHTNQFSAECGGTTVDKARGKSKARRRMTASNDVIRFTCQYLNHASFFNSGVTLMGHIVFYYQS